MSGGRLLPIVAAVAGLAVGASAMALAGGDKTAPADPQRSAIEEVVRDYILAHPEIIPEAMTRLKTREETRLVADHRRALETPFAGAWAGAAAPDVTLVEFFDYACGFCRASLPDVDRLIREDGKLRVVFRELPILTAQSEVAARVSLAAAKQGRFLDFHRALYAKGRQGDAELAAVGKASGLDPAAAARDARAADIQGEIDDNLALARALKLDGTPAFVVGDRILNGAVGYDALKQAIEEARKAKG